MGVKIQKNAMSVMIMGECSRKQSERESNEIRDTQPSARSTGLAGTKYQTQCQHNGKKQGHGSLKLNTKTHAWERHFNIEKSTKNPILSRKTKIKI